MALQITSSGVLPWMGGPSVSSSPDRTRNFHAQKSTTAATSVNIGTETTSRTSNSRSTGGARSAASRGNQGSPKDHHDAKQRRTHEVLTYHALYFGMAQLEADRRAAELLDVFDLTAKANTKPNRLSGGMRRRLLIARALVHRPRLLILDEPTAGVDLELRRELWSYLRRLHQHEDTTVLLTTHYLEEAEELCERLAFIRQGELSAQGTVGELVQRYGGADFEDAYVEAMR